MVCRLSYHNILNFDNFLEVFMGMSANTSVINGYVLYMVDFLTFHLHSVK
ncbi:hypothetical protein [Moraxella lacunata]